MKLTSLDRRPSRQSSMMMIGVVACAVVGCGGRTRSDFYRQKLASEVRILEDQLYEADYQNRVLLDDLERYRRKVHDSKIPLDPSPASPIILSGDPVNSGASAGSIPIPVPDPAFGGIDDELAMPEFDLGDPIETGEVRDGTSTDGATPQETTGVQPLPPPRGSGGDDSSKPLVDPEPAEDASPPKLNDSLLPPVSPEPPGEKDLQVDPIIPGDILPPPSSDTPADTPGQIVLPTSLRTPPGVPNRLRIHRSRSAPLGPPGETNGVKIVVGAIDHQGNQVDWSAFAIEAELTVVVLDPSRPPEQARLGRWDFASKQIPKLIADDPLVGLEIPVQWDEKRPQTGEVVVHVRLRGDRDEMRCDSTLLIGSKANGNSPWTPRGE